MPNQTSEKGGEPHALKTWLFNPFRYVAGWTALGIGVVGILLTGALGFLSRSHVDGVLDFHTGMGAPIWFFVLEGFIDWLSMGALLLLAGLCVSGSRFRIVDLLGTQAMARLPCVVSAMFALLPGYGRSVNGLMALGAPPTDPSALVNKDLAYLIVVSIIVIVMIVWMVALMYRGFSVSCNARGGKAIGAFIVALLLAEVLSKIAILSMARVALS